MEIERSSGFQVWWARGGTNNVVRRIWCSVEIQLDWKSIYLTMLNKYSRFRDSETVPEGTEFCNKMSAKTSEVASPVQFLSDSDETEENLSPALAPQFRKLPGV